MVHALRVNSVGFGIFAERPQRTLEPEQRPPVVRVILEFLAVHVHGPLMLTSFLQRVAQPLPEREVQRLWLVVSKAPLDLGGFFEDLDRALKASQRS